MQMPFEDIESCRVKRDCCKTICCRKQDVVVIKAKIDFSNNLIPFLMDAEAFVLLVNAMMMMMNKKKENEDEKEDNEVAIMNENSERSRKLL
jgi:hypothetical protein